MLDKNYVLLGFVFFLGCADDPVERAGSGPKTEVAVDQKPSPSTDLLPWHEDFPGAPDSPVLSPRAARSWYDKSRRQAIRKVVANLQGNCSKLAWRMARQFFDRAEVEDLPLLIEQMDRAYQVPSEATIVGNTVEAMGRAKNPIFAEAIIRALNHPTENVRVKAMEALIYSGNRETVLRAGNLFSTLPQQSQIYWLKAAGAHLGADVVAAYRDVITAQNLTPLHPTIISEADKLPPELAVEVFRPLWANPPPKMRPHIAGLLHANGEAAGSLALERYLREGDTDEKMVVLHTLRKRDSRPFADLLLQLSSDPSPQVRAMLVQLFRDLHDERADSVLETMAVMEDMSGLRQTILRILVEHGRRGHLDELIETIRTGTGTSLRQAIGDVVAAKDGQAVAAIDERMQKAPIDERRGLLQAIGHVATRESFAPLKRVFLAAEDIFPGSSRYAAVLLMNARGAESETLELWDGLAPSDYRHRAQVIRILASIAADREDPELQRNVYVRLRSVVADRTEIPQMRLLALELLRKDLNIGDAMRIKRMLTKEGKAMQRAFNNFLFEFF